MGRGRWRWTETPTFVVTSAGVCLVVDAQLHMYCCINRKYQPFVFFPAREFFPAFAIPESCVAELFPSTSYVTTFSVFG